MAKARQEAHALSKKAQHVERILRDISNLLEYREKNPSRKSSTTTEGSVEATIQQSFDECRKCLQATNHALEPLARIPPGQLVGATHRLKWVFTDKFIKRKEKEIESEFQKLSMSLLLLQNITNQEYVDRAKVTQRLLFRLIKEIRDEGPDNQPSSSKSSLLREELTQVLNEVLGDRDLNEFDIENQCEEEFGNGDTVEQYDAAEGEEPCAWDEALQIAVKRNQGDIIRDLRRTDADFYRRDSEDLTLLHHAVLRNAEESLIALLESKPAKQPDWMNLQSKRGLTALMYATMLATPDKSVTLARILIENGCNINIKDKQGRSAICFAIDGGGPSPERKVLVKLLLDNHAEPGPAFVWAREQARRYADLRKHSTVAQRPVVRRTMSSRI